MNRFHRYLSQTAVLASIFMICASVQAAAYDDLLRAAELGDATGVDQMLGKGMDPNTADAKGNTILMIATREGHQDVVRTLIRRKANANRRNQYGDTALMIA